MELTMAAHLEAESGHVLARPAYEPLCATTSHDGRSDGLPKLDVHGHVRRGVPSRYARPRTSERWRSTRERIRRPIGFTHDARDAGRGEPLYEHVRWVRAEHARVWDAGDDVPRWDVLYAGIGHGCTDGGADTGRSEPSWRWGQGRR